jgi:hypothetical protein
MSATDFGDPQQIIHIPARDLRGTRDAKLAELDIFLAQLQLVRLALCGKTVRLAGFVDEPGEPPTDRGTPAWTRLHTVLNTLRSAAGRTKGRRS